MCTIALSSSWNAKVPSISPLVEETKGSRTGLNPKVELSGIAVRVPSVIPSPNNSLRRGGEELLYAPGFSQGVQGEVLIAYPGALSKGEEVGGEPGPEGGLGGGDGRCVGRAVRVRCVLPRGLGMLLRFENECRNFFHQCCSSDYPLPACGAMAHLRPTPARLTHRVTLSALPNMHWRLHFSKTDWTLQLSPDFFSGQQLGA